MGVPANGCGISLGDNENILKLDDGVMIVQLCEYTTNHWLLYFQSVNFMVCKLYLTKKVIINVWGKGQKYTQTFRSVLSTRMKCHYIAHSNKTVSKVALQVWNTSLDSIMLKGHERELGMTPFFILKCVSLDRNHSLLLTISAGRELSRYTSYIIMSVFFNSQ